MFRYTSFKLARFPYNTMYCLNFIRSNTYCKVICSFDWYNMLGAIMSRDKYLHIAVVEISQQLVLIYISVFIKGCPRMKIITK